MDECSCVTVLQGPSLLPSESKKAIQEGRGSRAGRAGSYFCTFHPPVVSFCNLLCKAPDVPEQPLSQTCITKPQSLTQHFVA